MLDEYGQRFPEADEAIKELSYQRAHELYGENLPKIVQERIDQELKAILKNGFSSLFLLNQKLVQKSIEAGYPVGFRLSVGASFVAFLIGITEVNPLPPHWYCSKCHYSEFITDGSYYSGFDLPAKKCPQCGDSLSKDGHDMPSAVFFGFDGDKEPNIDLNFSESYRPQIDAYLKQLLGHDKVYAPGIIKELPEKTVYEYAQKYFEEKGETPQDSCTHDGLTLIKILGDLTHCDYKTIPFDDSSTFSLFHSTEALSVSPEDLGATTGTLGVPEFQEPYARRMLDEIKPTCFSDLVKMVGFCYGTEIWKGNMQDALRDGVCTLHDAISVRDDIMMYLIRKGIDPLLAYKTMENVRKGKGIKPDVVEKLKDEGVPKWYIEACQTVRYLCPRAAAVSSAMTTYRIAYYKAHYPLEFYAAYFTLHAEVFDVNVVTMGKDAVKEHLEKLESIQRPDDKEKEEIYVLQLALEMILRGYAVEPVDRRQSDAEKFIIRDKSLLPPLSFL